MKVGIWILFAVALGMGLRLAVGPGPDVGGAAVVERTVDAGVDAASPVKSFFGDPPNADGRRSAPEVEPANSETADGDLERRTARARVTLRGVVLDGGMPVVDAPVELRGPERSQRWRARSDRQGRFAFSAIPTGLRAELRLDPLIGAVEGKNGRPYLEVVVDAATPVVELHLVPSSTLRVRVQDPSGAAPRWSEVRLHRGAARTDTLVDRVRSRTGDARFALVRGARGPLVVTARTRGAFGWTTVDWSGRGRVDECAITLDPLGSIHGLVEAVGAPSTVVATSLDPSVPQRRSLRASDDGSFELTDLVPGRYELVVDDRTASSTTVDVLPGVATGPLRLGEERVVAGVVSGTVVDENGVPVAGVTLRATPAVAEASVHEHVLATSADGGAFSVELRASGTHRLSASVSGLTRGATAVATTNVEAGDSDVRLVLARRTSGTVRALLRAPDGVESVRVVVGSSLEGAVGLYAPGEVEIPAVPAGRAILRFEVGRVVAATREVDVPAGDVVDLGAVDLTEVGVVELEVVGPGGEPVDGVAVHAESASTFRKLPPDARSRVGTTDTAGRCAVAAIGVAPARLLLLAEGLAAQYVELDPSDAGARRRVEMQSGADLQLEGLRVLMDGALAWRIVVASATTGETVRTRGVNRFVGSVLVPGLPYGTYTLRVHPTSQTANDLVHGWAGEATLSMPGRRVVRLDRSARPEEAR